MDHWHSALCHSPVVELGEDLLPHCLACGCSFSLSDLLSRQGPSSYLPIPPDKPLGELNLSWPSTVRYSDDQSRRSLWRDSVQSHHRDGSDLYERRSSRQHGPSVTGTSGTGLNDLDTARYSYDHARRTLWDDSVQPHYRYGSGPYERRSSLQHEFNVTGTSGTGTSDLDTARRMLLQLSVKDVSTAPQPYIYERRLSQDEIRLICIPETTDDAAPIHISLEVYQVDRCPEYETLSYTWGGEDNDSARIHPIYIGQYWHALLQTRNCWDMLRFLRPSRGVRLVWIDAICINQLDDEERAIQVGKMARIYENCQRVVVFLGKDVVRKEPGRYPRRRKLGDALRPDAETGELTNAEDIDITSILRKRYFKRVWIIQELILAPRVVIQIDDVQLWVDPRAPLYPGRWDLTPVPWFIYLTQKQLEESSIYDILRTTWSNEATDIRDKIFGVHALLRNPECSKAFQPDYTLSCLEAYIGVFAYLLLHEKRIEVLYNAAGISMQTRRPTWFPDWTVPDVTKVFRPVPPNGFDKQCAKGACGCVRSAAYCLLRKFKDLSEDEHRAYLDSISQVQDRPDERKRYETANGQPKPRRSQRSIVHISSEPGTLATKETMGMVNKTFQHHRPKPPEESRASWDSTVSVNSRTGALKIDLLHILMFRTKPRAWGVWESSQLYRLEAIDGEGAIYLTVQGLALDKMIIPYRDHLFVLWCGTNQPYIYLILREERYSHSPDYTLVGVCSYLCLEVNKHRSSEIDTDDVDNVHSDIDDTDDYDSDIDYVDDVDTQVSMPDLLLSPISLPLYLRDLLCCVVKKPREIDKLNRLFPVTSSKYRNEVLQTLASAQLRGYDRAERRFTEAYIASIPSHFRPRSERISRSSIDKYRVEISVHPEDWNRMRGKYTGSDKGPFKVLETRDKTIRLGALVRKLAWLAEETESYRALLRAGNFAWRIGRKELNIGWKELKAITQPEDERRRIADPQWQRDIVKGFKIDGTTYSVNII